MGNIYDIYSIKISKQFSSLLKNTIKNGEKYVFKHYYRKWNKKFTSFYLKSLARIKIKCYIWGVKGKVKATFQFSQSWFFGSGAVEIRIYYLKKNRFFRNIYVFIDCRFIDGHCCETTAIFLCPVAMDA